MIMIGLYSNTHPQDLERSEGPFTADDFPWDMIRMWQTLWTVVVKVIPHS